jgi:hypothetical protein
LLEEKQKRPEICVLVCSIIFVTCILSIFSMIRFIVKLRLFSYSRLSVSFIYFFVREKEKEHTDDKEEKGLSSVLYK